MPRELCYRYVRNEQNSTVCLQVDQSKLQVMEEDKKLRRYSYFGRSSQQEKLEVQTLSFVKSFPQNWKYEEFSFKMSVTGSVVGKSQKMQLRDEANAADTNTSGELTFSSISKVSAKIYFLLPLEFIDKIESNFLWIKWMKVRCVQVQEAAPDAVHTQLPKFESPICDKKVHRSYYHIILNGINRW